MDISPEDALALKDAGHIGEDTYQQIVAQNTPPAAPLPGLGTPTSDDAPTTETPQAEPAAPEEPAKAPPGMFGSKLEGPITDAIGTSIANGGIGGSGGPEYAPAMPDGTPPPAPPSAAPTGPVQPAQQVQFGGGPQMMPGYSDPSTWPMLPMSETTQTQEGVHVSPKDLQMNREANENALKAQDQINYFATQKAAQQANFENQMASIDKERQGQEADKRAVESDEIQRSMGAVDKARQEASNLRVDPSKFWHDRGTAGTIAGAISIGLGALGSAFTHGPNYALQIIDNGIQNDIRAQENNIDQKNKAVDFARGSLQDLRQKIGDDRVAREVDYQLKMKSAQSQLAAAIGAYRSPEAAANGQLLSAGMAQKIAESNMRIQSMIQDRVVKSTTSQRTPPLGTLTPDMRERLVTTPEGQQMLANTKEDAKEIKDRVAEFGPYMSSLQELKAIRNQYGNQILPTAVAGRAKALAANLRMETTKLKGLNRITGEEVSMINNFIPEDPTKIGQVMAGLDVAESVANKTLASQFQARGLPYRMGTSVLNGIPGAKPLGRLVSTGGR